MISRIAHIAIAVRNLESSKALFEKLLGSAAHHEEEVKGQKVRTAMFHLGDSALELLEGTDAESAIARFVEKRGEGIHHISLESDDVRAESERLRSLGFEPLNPPSPGADNTLVTFFHPRSTNGVLIEISQHAGEQKSGRG